MSFWRCFICPIATQSTSISPGLLFFFFTFAKQTLKLSARTAAKSSFLLNKLQRGLVRKTKAHVIVRLLQLLLLGFHLLLLSWGSTCCGSRTSSPYITDGAPNVDIGQGLCKQARPKSFNIHAGSLNKGIDLILCVGDLIVMREERE
jgi:hypothetical protein